MRKAFTLIEMVIVIVLLGILASIIVPSQATYVNAAKGVNATAVYKNFKTSMTAFKALSESNSTQVVKNDHDYKTTGLQLGYDSSGVITQSDVALPGTLASLGPTTEECVALLAAFGNIPKVDIVPDPDINLAYPAWTAKGEAFLGFCRFTYSPTSQEFFFTPADDNLSNLG